MPKGVKSAKPARSSTAATTGTAAPSSGGFLSKIGIVATVVSSVVSLLFFLFFVILLVPGLVSKAESATANVAVIDVDGVITTGDESPFGGGGGAKSDDIIDLLREADDDESIKAIVLRINSPGGTPVATEEIANEVNVLSKPSVAVIRESGTSGAYWVASATDHVIASRMSIVGSIGVLSSYVDASGFLKRYNFTYVQLTAGKYKDAGSPLRPLEEEERVLFQKLLARTHDEFISAVATNRKMPREDVVKLATGFVFLGSEGKELGLVDQLGGLEDAYEYLRLQLNTTIDPVTFSRPPTFFEALSSTMSPTAFSLGQGIGSSLFSAEAQGPKVWT